jgi:hypothetical protein
MSDEFDSLDESEKDAVQGALDRCRVIGDQIVIKLREVSPEQFAYKLSLADFHLSALPTPLDKQTDSLIPRRRGAVGATDIEGDFRPEINLALLRTAPNVSSESRSGRGPNFFESRSGKLKMQQKFCRR